MVLEESGGGSGRWNKEEVERVSAWAADRQTGLGCDHQEAGSSWLSIIVK